MSLTGGFTLNERRRWVFRVAPRLYKLQQARFGYQNRFQARERKLAWKLVKLAKGPVYLVAISKTILSLENLKQVSKYFKYLLNAEEDQDFASLITGGIGIFPHSDTDLITSAAVDEGMVNRIVTRYTNALDEGTVLTPQEFLEEMSRYALGLGTFMLYNSASASGGIPVLPYTVPGIGGSGLIPLPTGKKYGVHMLNSRMVEEQSVPCVIGGLPLRHITEIEIARSGKILKFRATGSVFLANQEGGEDAIRIEGKIFKQEILFILFLVAIFLYGQGRVREIDSLLDVSLSQLREKSFDIKTFNRRTTRPSYEHHNTTPLVTRHVIIPNAFIETLSFERRVIDGLDVIKYSILLRTYRKPVGFDFYSGNPYLGFIAPSGNKALNMYKVIEFAANAAWRTANSNGYFIDEREWKIGGDASRSDDVYYDIDPVDLAITTALGISGVI